MNKVTLIFVALIVVFTVTVHRSSASESESLDEHTEWITKSLEEMLTIKAGMTRADLLKVFAEEGGISTRSQRRYVYHGNASVMRGGL